MSGNGPGVRPENGNRRELVSPSGWIPGDRYVRRTAGRTRRRLRLVRASLGSALQVGLSAGMAWWLATLLLPWDDPLYAPIGAVVAIGTGEDRLLDRPLRLLAGMVVAVAVAGVVVALVGGGAWQIGVVTLLSTLIGRMLFDDTLARTYSAFHGAVIGALGVSQVIPEQLVEASIGAVVGILVAHVVFPPDVRTAILTPVHSAGYAARRCLRALVSAMRTGDHGEMERATQAATEIEAYLAPDDQRRTFGRQLVRLAPARWRETDRAERLIDADQRLTTLLLGVADLTRLARGLLTREDGEFAAISGAMEELDVALGWVLREPFEGDFSQEMWAAVERLEARLDSLQEMSRPQAMLCENLRELGEYLSEVGDWVAERTQDDR